MENETAFYTLGLHIDQDTIAYRGYEIWKYSEPRWDLLISVREELLYNASYNAVGSYSFNEKLTLYVNSTDPVITVKDTSITPTQVGLIGIYGAEGLNKTSASRPLYVIFYDLLVTVNAPPWFVNITGVPDGWRVILRDSTGRSISSGVSTNGIVTLNISGYLIVPSGVIEIYDENGDFVDSRVFDYIVGGESYSVRVYEFKALVIGVGGSTSILIYNITSVLEDYVLVDIIEANSLFNGFADLAIASGKLYLLNASGVFRYSFAQMKWIIITDLCKATGISARLEVVRDMLITIPGLGNNTLCLYNLTMQSPLNPYDIATRDRATVVEYTSTVISGYNLYISLHNESIKRPVIAVYMIYNNDIALIGYYNITGYRLLGLTHNGFSKLYFIYEYGGVYELDTATGDLKLLPIILPFTPRGFGDRLEYCDGYLIFVRGDETTELYIILLTT